jgi:RND family efflux transporter MFP subunit
VNLLKNRIRSYFAIIIIAALCQICSSGAVEAQDQEKPSGPALPPARVEVKKVERVPVLYRGFRESSTLEAMEEVVIYPRVTGRLEEFSVREGDPVKKGQVIAELDHRDVDAQINSIKAQINVAQARLASARASFENAKGERERYQKLVKEGYATSQQLESKETAYLQAQADVNLQKASIQQSKAELARNEVNLSEYFIKSPIDGRVMEDYSHTVGEMISPSVAIARVGVTEDLKAVIKAPSARSIHLRKGMKALLSITSLGSENLEGKITLISPSVDAATRTTTVEVGLSNGKDELKPGMFAEVFIIEKEVVNALAIPKDALFKKDGQTWVFVVEENVAVRTPVILGLENDTHFEVVQGLSEGEEIVVSGGNTLQDGDKVSVVR